MRLSVTALALVAAALLAAGCGDDEETTATTTATSEQPEKLTALEESLQESISDVREEEPEIEAIDCPAGADLSEDPAKTTCTVSGGEEFGTVEVTLRGNEYDYTGAFAGSSFGGTDNEIQPSP